MTEKKKIPCRVCGKLFEPCSTCQSNNRMFRLRNFACSLKCAEKYISDTVTYRESLKQPKNNITDFDNNGVIENTSKTNETTKRKYNKRTLTNNVEMINKESEQID